ncbi:hypothetical protein SAMN02746062_00896 [Alysiella filiformis DSM 16848]|uniref:Single-strand binding protein family protein n=2 Tax=Alysiella TaxID=194195 RepID=A0A286E914_9NEIS|nr:hypothetical protein SAMN02746062_00896 [Alysiella filiformis DSM 16848]
MIDGIVSGRLVLAPKIMRTNRGSQYLIAKITVFAYRNSNLDVQELDGDVIAFDPLVIDELMRQNTGDVISIAGIITPILQQKRAIGQDLPVTLYITAKKIYADYVHGQAKGKGGLFQLLGVK